MWYAASGTSPCRRGSSRRPRGERRSRPPGPRKPVPSIARDRTSAGGNIGVKPAATRLRHRHVAPAPARAGPRRRSGSRTVNRETLAARSTSIAPRILPSSTWSRGVKSNDGTVPTSATQREVVLATFGHAGLDDVRHRSAASRSVSSAVAQFGLGLAHLGRQILGVRQQRMLARRPALSLQRRPALPSDFCDARTVSKRSTAARRRSSAASNRSTSGGSSPRAS